MPMSVLSVRDKREHNQRSAGLLGYVWLAAVLEVAKAHEGVAALLELDALWIAWRLGAMGTTRRCR
jgi:hypothetical protein